jgi:hypothetical protein
MLAQQNDPNRNDVYDLLREAFSEFSDESKLLKKAYVNELIQIGIKKYELR